MKVEQLCYDNDQRIEYRIEISKQDLDALPVIGTDMLLRRLAVESRSTSLVLLTLYLTAVRLESKDAHPCKRIEPPT